MQKNQIIYVFPGQGSQYAGMGKYFYKNNTVFHDVIACASDLMNIDFKKILFESSESEIKKTINAQPAITVINIAYLELLKSLGLSPAAVAGHSLGELSAYYSANVLEQIDLLEIVKQRAQLMQTISENNLTGMLAIVGIDKDQICSLVNGKEPNISIANVNSDKQIVVAGELEILKKFSYICLKSGALKVTLLNVSGAWHSSLMKPIVQPFSEYLNNFSFSNASIPIYCNTTASATTESSLLKTNLAQQLNSTVLWSDIMKNIIEDYPRAVFFEVGPGKVLKGLLLQNDMKRICISMDNINSLSEIEKYRGY